MKKTSSAKTVSPLREVVSSILWALTLALLLKASVVSANIIPSGSMQPTLDIGDMVLVNRMAYDLKAPYTHQVLARLGEPQRGDVVVFANPAGQGDDFIKRIMGLPGEQVELRGGVVHINGRPLATDWGHGDPGHLSQGDDFGPVTVPAESFFMLGDNRDHSFDSRFWRAGGGGFVPRQDIRGRALVIYYSFQDWPWLVRWSRLGTLLN